MARLGRAPALAVKVERWPITGGFAISRGAKHEAVVVVASIGEAGHTGRGECVPYAHYGESVEGVAAAIEACAPAVARGLSRAELAALLPAGAARNALDCALWDLEAKRSGRSAASLAGIGALHPVLTAFTLSLGTPEAMAEAARQARAIRCSSSSSAAMATSSGSGPCARRCLRLGSSPMPTKRGNRMKPNRFWPKRRQQVSSWSSSLYPPASDELLSRIARPVPVCADKLVHDRASLDALSARYDAVNIKLDKTGGLTEALLVAGAPARSG